MKNKLEIVVYGSFHPHPTFSFIFGMKIQTADHPTKIFMNKIKGLSNVAAVLT